MRVASDIGGTFTDLVYLDPETGAVGVTKVSTTPANFAEGVVESLGKAALNVSGTRFFVHGSTIIINALTERKGVKTGLITGTGGGYGDPLERPVEVVQSDVKNGYITPEQAGKHYGVVLNPGTLEVEKIVVSGGIS